MTAVDIEQRLAVATASLREHEAVEARCRELDDRVERLVHEVARLRSDLAGEERDVARLKRPSLARLRAALGGPRDDALARQHAEAHEVRQRLAATETHLDEARREWAAALVRLGELATAPEAHRAVLADKERHLRASDDPRGLRLSALAAERELLNDELRALVAAGEAAETAQQALFEALGGFSRASSLSAVDTFLGGGLITSLVKRSRMNQAGDAALDAEQCLAALRAKLAVLAEAEGRPVSVGPAVVGPVARVVDVWFDNVFTDYLVGSRIRTAQDNVARAIEMVREVQQRLWQRTAGARERLGAIDHERRAVLTA